MIRAAGRSAVVVALAGVLAASCSGSKGLHAVTPHASVPTAPAQTTTTNPYAVPAVIDAAYVNRVLAALDAAMGDVVRIVMHARGLTPEAHSRMQALYREPELAAQVNLLIDDSARGFAGYRDEPGNRKTTVVDVLTGSPECIFVHVKRDASDVTVAPSAEASDQYVALRPVGDVKRVDEVNPTSWIEVYEGFMPDHSQPPNPCVKS